MIILDHPDLARGVFQLNLMTYVVHKPPTGPLVRAVVISCGRDGTPVSGVAPRPFHATGASAQAIIDAGGGAAQVEAAVKAQFDVAPPPAPTPKVTA